MEVILVIMPIYLFFSVQISKSRKATIFASFLPRIAYAFALPYLHHSFTY